MRNFLVQLVALGGLATLVMPAAAESNHGSCGTSSVTASSGPIDLEAIPMMNATGPKAVKGGGDDECDARKTVSDGTRADREEEEFGDGDD